MTDKPQVTTFRAAEVGYRYVSVTRIVGLTNLPEDRDFPLDLGRSDARAFLTANPNPSLASLDRAAALGYLLLSGFEGKGASADVLQEASRLCEERAQKRLKDSGPSVFLVVEVHGKRMSKTTEVARDLGGAVMAFDAVDKDEIKATHQSLVSSAVTAVVLILNTASDVVDTLDGVELTLSDGRPLYSFTASMGLGRATIARPANVEDARNFKRTITALLADNRLMTPTRLFVDALRSAHDRLESFILAWAALEMLIGKHTSRSETGAWINSVPVGNRAAAEALHKEVLARTRPFYSFADRTKAFTLSLGIADWAALVAQIVGLRRQFREPLYHEGVIDERNLPVDTVIGLVRRLITEVVAQAGTTPNSVGKRRSCKEWLWGILRFLQKRNLPEDDTHSIRMAMASASSWGRHRR